MQNKWIVSLSFVAVAFCSSIAHAEVFIDSDDSIHIKTPRGTHIEVTASRDLILNGKFISSCDGSETTKISNNAVLNCSRSEINLSADPTAFQFKGNTINISEGGFAEQVELSDISRERSATTSRKRVESSESVEFTSKPNPSDRSLDSCLVPAGTYNYLFSDGEQTFYYDESYTVRVDRAGNQILQKGDFKISLFGNTYQRDGDEFIYKNTLGTYSSKIGESIYFAPSSSISPELKTILGLSSGQYSNEFGTYSKRTGGQILFTPRLRFSPLVVNNSSCKDTISTTKITSSSEFNVKNEESTHLVIKDEGQDLSVELSNDVLFDFDKDRITPRSADILDELSDVIQRERRGYVIVTGHTDNIGSNNYNQELSERRAKEVANWLIERAGLQKKDVISQGLGERYPVAANTDLNGEDLPENRALNRRVEVVIQKVRREPNYITSRYKDLITSAGETARKAGELGAEGARIGVEGAKHGVKSALEGIDAALEGLRQGLGQDQ